MVRSGLEAVYLLAMEERRAIAATREGGRTAVVVVMAS